KDGIFFVSQFPKVEIISQDNGNYIKSKLFTLKEKILEKINLAFGPPENLLLGGLLLGEKSALSGELKEKFIKTGTIHIVALSGYNITLISGYFIWFFSLVFVFLRFVAASIDFVFFQRSDLGNSKRSDLGKKTVALSQSSILALGIFSIILFVLMTGASSTAIRAGIMAILVLFAQLIGRSYHIARALILAGVIMVFINPFILVYDISFQLSFMATIAIIFYVPKIKKYFVRIPQIHPVVNFQDVVASTVAAYIFVLPFILYKMGIFSVFGILVNILILPFIPFTTILGFVTILISFISHNLAMPFVYLTSLFLNFELNIINFFANFSFAAFPINNFSLGLTVLIYLFFTHYLFGEDIKNFLKNIDDF
ncbi:MAG: ComEC/Rec2 family competence protein, partial [Patescibacteria group bacterium]